MKQLMACVQLFISLLLILLSLCVPHAIGETNSAVLVATLSATSGSPYVLNLPLGSPAQNLPLLLDLQGSTTSLSCSRTSATNSSVSGFFNPSLSSTFHNLSADSGGTAANCTAAEDGVNSLYIQRTAFGDPFLSVNVSGVDFQCCTAAAPPYAGVAGVAGFSTGSLSLPSQISKNAGLAWQFAYCSPSIMFFGRATTYAYLDPFPGQIKTFTPGQSTRLYYVKNPLASSSDGRGTAGYAISLQNITVEGNVALVLQKPIKLRISTTEAFTRLERSLYKAVRAQFRQAIGYGSIVKKMPAVPPFDTCFDSTPLYYAAQAPHLKSPVIGLILEGGATWFLLPHHTFMVYNSTLACLAVLNAGAGRPSVLGTFQQQDTLLEFDLQHSRFALASLFDPSSVHPETPGCFGMVYPLYYPQ